MLGVLVFSSPMALSAAEVEQPNKAASDLSVLQPQLRKTQAWKFLSVEKEFPINVYFLDETTGSEPREVIVYVMNRAWERIGMEDDLSILRDYINRKFIVVTIDLGNTPEATSPRIDEDLHMLYRALYGHQTPSIIRSVKLEPQVVRCFFLPAGYRVATHLEYWNIAKHGVHGTLEHIMKSYNGVVVPKITGRKPAEKPADMVDRNGKPFDYGIKMDIVYPSQTDRKLPTFVYSDTQASRNTHHRYLFQMRGYVYVVMGHCFNPCVTHYWHFSGFTLDHWNGLACYTAAMRYLNKYADTYRIDSDHVGMMGISKGQYAVTRLSDPNHTAGTESKTYEGAPLGTPEPQPWPGYPSRIHAGWQGMGMGLWEREYITPDYAPTILACGENDRELITKEGNVLFLTALEKQDANHVNLFMEELGHSISYGFDKRLGVDRYQLVLDFFDRYLKPLDKLPPVVLVAHPRDGGEVAAAAPDIWVQFAPVIEAQNVLGGKAIKVVRLSDNQLVPGTWKISHGGTKCSFTPTQPLAPGSTYEVIATTAVTDRAGIALASERRFRFTTTP